MGKRIIAFGYYGGKYSHLGFLLPLLPECHHYCEPFGGSAAVLLNREPSPVETYNDLNGDVVHFLRTLRNQTTRLTKALELTPYSREEYLLAIGPQSGRISDLERARRFFIRIVMTRMARQRPTPGRWRYSRMSSNRGRASKVSVWENAPEKLQVVAERLLRVQIEHDDAIRVIERYDTPQTLFYCDPPYPSAVRQDKKVYDYEMTWEQHEWLAEVLASVEGLVAVSSYASPETDRLYSAFTRIDGPEKTLSSSVFLKSPKATKKREALYVNYEFVDEA